MTCLFLLCWNIYLNTVVFFWDLLWLIVMIRSFGQALALIFVLECPSRVDQLERFNADLQILYKSYVSTSYSSPSFHSSGTYSTASSSSFPFVGSIASSRASSSIYCPPLLILLAIDATTIHAFEESSPQEHSTDEPDSPSLIDFGGTINPSNCNKPCRSYCSNSSSSSGSSKSSSTPVTCGLDSIPNTPASSGVHSGTTTRSNSNHGPTNELPSGSASCNREPDREALDRHIQRAVAHTNRILSQLISADRLSRARGRSWCIHPCEKPTISRGATTVDMKHGVYGGLNWLLKAITAEKSRCGSC